MVRPSRPIEGRFAIVTNVGRDAVDAGCATDECAMWRTAKSCRPDALVAGVLSQSAQAPCEGGDKKAQSRRGEHV